MDRVFVSRAGDKLQFALDCFDISVKGKICADFGSSTGGFVDCLLVNGAERVYAVDTSYGELDWKLRNETKVKVFERTNAMHIRLPEKVDLITIDVGWTKQVYVLPNAFANLKVKGVIVSLIKLHYESPKTYLKKGKLMDEKTEDVLNKVKLDIYNAGGKIEKMVKSPVLGGRAKNQEYLAYISCLMWPRLI